MLMALLLSLGGCATQAGPGWSLPLGQGPAPVEFLAQALQAGPAKRESMWQSVRNEEFSAEQQLRRALMQSLPQHSGYEPAAAQRQLRKLAARPLASELRALARLRLLQLEDGGQCQAEVRRLRQRMADVVDIERELNRGARP